MVNLTVKLFFGSGLDIKAMVEHVSNQQGFGCSFLNKNNAIMLIYGTCSVNTCDVCYTFTGVFVW